MAGTDIYKSSFFPQTIRDWNLVTDSLITASEQVLYKCNIEVLDLNRSLKPRSRFENVQKPVHKRLFLLLCRKLQTDSPYGMI